MIKVSQVRSIGRRCILIKAAALGDIVNAGLSTMANGSPLVPRHFIHGTNKPVSTRNLQQQQINTAKAGLLGGAIGAGFAIPSEITLAGAAASAGHIGHDAMCRALDGRSAFQGLRDVFGGRTGVEHVERPGPFIRPTYDVLNKQTGKNMGTITL